MYLLYVDESGDTGRAGIATQYFALSGLVVHELAWNKTLDAIIAFRKTLRQQYGLKLRDEIHAGQFVQKSGSLHLRRDLRLRILRDVLLFQASLTDVSIINVLIHKDAKPPTYDIFENAWMTMMQRFYDTIRYQNFPGPKNPQDYGLVIVDRTDEKKLRDLSRRMRRFNPIRSKFGSGYRNLPVKTMVEDAVHRDSKHSYFIQLADVNAYFLYQQELPCKYVRQKGARSYFSLLDPVLCKVARPTDPQGIVRL